MKQQSQDDSFLQYMKINNQEEQERIVAKYESMLRNHPTNWAKNISIAFKRSSSVSKDIPLKLFFIVLNRQKSQGERFGE